VLAAFMEGPTSGELGRPAACYRREGAPPTGTVRAGCFCGRPDLGARLLAFEAGLRPAIAAGARPQGTARAGCFCGRADLGARLFEAFCEEIHFHQARGRTGFDQRSRR